MRPLPAPRPLTSKENNEYPDTCAQFSGVAQVTAYKSRNRFSPANIGFHAFRATLMPFLSMPRQSCPIPPVVIGNMGGSGSRVLPKILRLTGFWMGAWINPQTQDAIATRCFLQRHFVHLTSHQIADQELMGEFSRMIAAHRRGIQDLSRRWGWKNPRYMWIIPFLSRVYPEMKFIHLVRDGRDMALSSNTNLLHKHGAFLLKDPDCGKNLPAAQLRLWTLGNRIAQTDGKRYLGSNYLLLNYEKLCLYPRETLTQLFDFLQMEAPGEFMDSACRLIIPSPNIGRWRSSDLALLHEPDEQTRNALEQFGYDTGDRHLDTDTAPAPDTVSCMG